MFGDACAGAGNGLARTAAYSCPMNAVTPITAGPDATSWEDALASLNSWRGRAIQCFAQSEAAVSETLLALAALGDRGAKVRLRRLVGQRFEDLDAALGPDGPFAAEGAKELPALAAFRSHGALRPALCHGVAKVALDRQGQWIVLLRLLAFRGRAAERDTLSFEQREAEAMLATLRCDGQKLGTALGNLRAALPH